MHWRYELINSRGNRLAAFLRISDRGYIPRPPTRGRKGVNILGKATKMGQDSSVRNKIVFITGASAGIGKATAEAFAREGARVIITARRLDRLTDLASSLKRDYKAETLPLALDVRARLDVENAVKSLPSEWANIDVLVNNAGLARGLGKLHEYDVDAWEAMIETNIKGLLYVSRAIIPGMVERQRGHIINMGSVAGHEAYPGGGVYCGSKHAVRGITNSLRMDLVDTPLRVTSIDPGLVETDFSLVRFNGDVARAKKPYEGLQPLLAEDIAELIIFAASRPAHVNINEIVVMPTSQASATLAHRVTPAT